MSEYLFKTNKEIKNCNECTLGSAIGFGKTQCLVDALVKNNNNPDCPLIELPPHGRLIDADALQRRIVELVKHGYVFDEVGCSGLIESAPTILEATE